MCHDFEMRVGVTLEMRVRVRYNSKTMVNHHTKGVNLS